jgi:hypothetical protein
MRGVPSGQYMASLTLKRELEPKLEPDPSRRLHARIELARISSIRGVNSCRRIALARV